HRTLRTNAHVDLDEHAGPQFALRIGQRGLHLNVACGLVDNGVDGGHASRELRAWPRVTGEGYVGAYLDEANHLLRDCEIHIDWTQRLKRNDRTARREVLTQIDLANA